MMKINTVMFFERMRKEKILQIMKYQKILREMKFKLTSQESPIDVPNEMYTVQHLLPMMDINQSQ